MPKISAPTVGEHRAAQRAALVRAAEAVLRDTGLAGINPRTVCARAGMARSSFYDYFPSKDDLLVAVAIDAFERWNLALEDALSAVEPGLAKLRALVDATMQMTAQGEHDIAGPLRQAELAPTRFGDLMTLHEELMRPVSTVIVELGVPHADRFATLAQGVLGSGIQLIQHGADPQATADDVYRLLTNGLPL